MSPDVNSSKISFLQVIIGRLKEIKPIPALERLTTGVHGITTFE